MCCVINALRAGGLFKKILADSNAIAQEKGMEPLIAFIDRCDYANK